MLKLMRPSIGKILDNSIEKSDAIVCLEGDGYHRVKKSLELFQRGLAKNIVISGGLNNPPFSLPAKVLLKFFLENGVNRKKIILEEVSLNTLQQAREVMKLVKAKKWRKIILVASDFHQLRAFLTFLKAMNDAKLKIRIFNVSVFRNKPECFKEEIKKIKEYGERGHLVSFSEALKYQKWKKSKK